jgi:hypothetical protein
MFQIVPFTVAEGLLSLISSNSMTIKSLGLTIASISLKLNVSMIFSRSYKEDSFTRELASLLNVSRQVSFICYR